MKLFGFNVKKVKGGHYKTTYQVEIPEKVFLINGYDVGDTQLEDVMFEVDFSKSTVKVKVDKESADYFSTLNEKMWLKRVEERALQIVSEGDEVEIPKSLMKKYGVEQAYLAEEMSEDDE